MRRKNLWVETIEFLRDHSLIWEEVDYVILDGECVIDKKNFEEVARDTNYDSGWGAQEIRGDLMLVGWNWWAVRKKYNGSEWWELRTMPIIPHEIETITKLTTNDWEDE
jgi:hypothetical protein